MKTSIQSLFFLLFKAKSLKLQRLNHKIKYRCKKALFLRGFPKENLLSS